MIGDPRDARARTVETTKAHENTRRSLSTSTRTLVMVLTLELECLTGAVGASPMHQPGERRPPLLLTRPYPHPRKPSMPPPPAEQGSGSDPQPATLILNKLPGSGYSMVPDGDALATAMSKGDWGTSTAAPSNGKPVAFDDLLMVFAQRGSAIIQARIGDLLDVKPRLPAILHGVQPEYSPHTTALLNHPLGTERENVAVRSLGINTKALHDQLSCECDLLMNSPIKDHPMVGAHSQYTRMVSLSIKPCTQPNCASPPPSASPLSTNRYPLLLVLAHHILEETSRINNKAFRNIGFHTMQVVSRRSGVNRRVRPRWSFVKPSTCSTSRISSRPPTASSGGRYAREMGTNHQYACLPPA